MEYSLDVRHLKKCYDGVCVVDDISFCVQRGEIFAFLGPNGAGKSTTISILTTLTSYDEGDIYVEGYRLGRQNNAIRQTIGIVFQDSKLDDTLSVYQNLILRCGLYHLFGKKAQERTYEIVKKCSLQDILQKRCDTLSGGQRRKVDIARALIPSPSLLILDEPSTGLDPASRKEMWQTITKLHKLQKLTVFMTTHYMEEAEIADHICMLNNGKIVLDGYKQELIARYQKKQLLLYSDARQRIAQILDRKHLFYQMQPTCILVETDNFFQIMSILRSCEMYLQGIGLHQGSMEEMYLSLMQEDTI